MLKVSLQPTEGLNLHKREFPCAPRYCIEFSAEFILNNAKLLGFLKKSEI
jgi:hypothetical protein